MNTPDTELEKIAVKLWNIALDEDNKNARQEFRDVLTQARTSRDTYWEERVRKEVPNALHEYAKWLLENPDAEPLVRRAKKNEIACAITNEDNLK